MSRKSAALITALAAITLTTLFTIRPSAAEIVGVQKTSWGLATFGETNVVGNYDALGWAVEEVNGVVYAGGNFLDVTNGAQTERQPYLATFASATGSWLSDFSPDGGGPVFALQAAPDGGLFVGGEMGSWNGQTIGALAKIDPVTGELWPGWNTRLYGGTSVVRDLNLGPDGWLYVGGSFSTGSDSNNPQTVHGVVRIDPDSGNIDWSWVPVTDGGGVWGVSASYTQPTVYIVGWDDIMGGKQVVGVSSTDPSQVTWDSFEINYPCCNHMFDVQATPYGTVFVVGEQHGAYMHDENNNMVLMASHVTAYDSRYQATNTRRGGDYQDIEMVGDRLYASCHCWGSHSTKIGGSPLPYSSDLANVGGTHTGSVNAVVAYNAQTGFRDQGFNPPMAGDIGGWGVLEASDGCIWIAGGINSVGAAGSEAPGRDLVRLCDENGPDPVEFVSGPATCTATLTGDTVAVAWDSVVGAVDYVIYRSVDGGNPFWRGRTAASPFTDTNRDAELVYSISSRDLAGTKSTSTVCTTEVVEEPVEQLATPANCVATIVDGNVNVAWDAVADADKYVVYRSVDGGTQFWRGATSDLTFPDTDREGQLTYYVAAKGADLDRSERGECQTSNDAPPPEPADITPVATCSVSQGDDVALTVAWDAVDEIDPLYVIYRSVDGGTQFWRGRTTGPNFADQSRKGEIEYYVEVKVGNDRSTRTTCTPVIQAN